MSKKSVSTEEKPKGLVCPFCGKPMRITLEEANLYVCDGCGFLAYFAKLKP